jgi:microcystin degradation protein MlrC
MKDARFGSPIKVEGRVIYLSDGEFVHKGPVFTGKKVAMGPTAVLEVGRMKIVVASRRAMTVDPELYRSQKIEPQAQDLVAVKSPSLFLPGYASLMGSVLHLDMPGVCRGNLQKVPFAKITRPICPLDEFAWDSAEKAVTL